MSSQSDSAEVFSSARVGFWAAIIFAVLLTAFNLTYLVMIASTAEDPWVDAASYAAR